MKSTKKWIEENYSTESLIIENSDFLAIMLKEYANVILVDFLDAIRDYERESHNLVGHDERESIEFVNIFLNNNKKFTPTQKEVKYYDCPDCGHRLTELEYMNVSHDFGCPKCGTSFQEFKLVTVNNS